MLVSRAAVSHHQILVCSGIAAVVAASSCSRVDVAVCGSPVRHAALTTSAKQVCLALRFVALLRAYVDERVSALIHVIFARLQVGLHNDAKYQYREVISVALSSLNHST